MKILVNKEGEIEFYYFCNENNKTQSQVAIDHTDPKELELAYVYTDPKSRRRGLASKLINHVIHRHNNSRIRIFIDPCEIENTNDDNFEQKSERRLLRLTNFYGGFGFKPSLKQREILYRDPE